MHQDQLASCREKLLELRRRLTNESRRAVESVANASSARDELSHVPTHPADRDREGLARDITVETNREHMIDAIDQALERVSDGSYGRCERCGHDIPKNRLNVLPFAVRCVNCEETREGE